MPTNHLVKAIALLLALWVVPVFGQMTLLGAGKPAAGGGASPTWTATGNPAAQDTVSTTATFSSVGIGSPAASDILVAVFSSENSIATSITCNGNAMTKQVEESTSLSGLQIWSITTSACGVTGSATTTFVATAPGGMRQEVLQVGKLTGVTAAPTSTGSAGAGPLVSPTVPSTGFAIVGAYAGSTVTLSWSGGTQDFNTITPGTTELFMVHATATGTVSETGTTNGNIHLVYVTWGP